MLGDLITFEEGEQAKVDLPQSADDYMLGGDLSPTPELPDLNGYAPQLMPYEEETYDNVQEGHNANGSPTADINFITAHALQQQLVTEAGGESPVPVHERYNGGASPAHDQADPDKLAYNQQVDYDDGVNAGGRQWAMLGPAEDENHVDSYFPLDLGGLYYCR